MAKKRERDIETRLVNLLANVGICSVKFLPECMAGMPDRLVLLPGRRVIWVELKTSSGVLSEIQKYRHAKLRELGQEVQVLWSTDDVDRFVESLKRETPIPP